MARVGTALVIAHRGASGYELENSLAAFRAAARLGADAVELDVHGTADGALVVHRDETIDGTHHIPRLNARQLQGFRLANSQPIPTLAQPLSGTAVDSVCTNFPDVGRRAIQAPV